MDGSTLWRAALVQAVAVAALSGLLALLLPEDFFDDWGWGLRAGRLDRVRGVDRTGAAAADCAGADRCSAGRRA